MKVMVINELAYESTINELDRLIKILAQPKTVEDIHQAVEDLHNLKYCIINTSFATETE